MDHRFFLREDVFARRSDDRVIFLDLANDRYFSAPADRLALGEEGRFLGPVGEEGHLWCARAAAQGLIGRARQSRSERTPKRFWLRRAPPRLAFVYALCWAGAVVDRVLPLREALSELRVRRMGQTCDPPEAARESARFISWRPLWPRAYVCLFEALALTWFLSARGQACDIVFGVRGRPFAAHCWAQCNATVLGDEAEYCRSFDVIVRA